MKGFDLGPIDFGHGQKNDFGDRKQHDTGEPLPVKDQGYGYNPWDDLSGEGWKSSQADPEDWFLALKETAEHDFDEAFRTLALKFLWDMFFSCFKPTQDVMESIVSQTIKVGADQILAQYQHYAGGPVADIDPTTCSALKEAYSSSAARFIAGFTKPMLDHVFMDRMRDLLRQGMKS